MDIQLIWASDKEIGLAALAKNYALNSATSASIAGQLRSSSSIASSPRATGTTKSNGPTGSAFIAGSTPKAIWRCGANNVTTKNP
jgi:hypothetical protein